MSLKIDRVQLEIVIGNDQARKRMREIDEEVRQLNREITKMQKTGADTSAHEARVKALRTEYDKLTNQIGLTGLSMKELRNRQKDLNAILNQLPGDSPLYKQYRKQLDDVNNRLRELRGNARQTESALSKFANGFNKYLPIVAGFVATITGTVMSFRKIAEEIAQMDDYYADAMKTTGMTRDQITNLNEEFKKMDTRTSREQLNLLARDAGKLGKSSKKDVLDFVEAGNQINVALGEDLGEEAIRNIGKIIDVFKLSTKEMERMDLKGQMLSVGSAINELGQSSTASEAYLVNFTQRLGGVASQAGISLQNILGYASALDQSGQAVEMSATALQKFIMSMMGDPAKYARIAGIEVKKFSDILATDANTAIKMVLRSLSEKGGFKQLVPIFQEMGMDGARAVGVLSALATNIEKVDEAQRISNDAFAEGTSITQEYNVKNENMMARLEKARKEFKEARLELGERLNPALLKSTSIMTYLIKVLPEVFNWLDKYGGIVFKLTALILAYNIGLKAQTVWTKLALVEKIKLTIASIRETASMIALNLQYVAGSRNVGQFTRSIKALWATLSLNPWGAVIAGLTAIGILVYELTTRNKKFTDQASAMVEINKKIAESVGRERGEVEMLLGVARNESISKNERIKAINRLNEISPEYLGNLRLENINTDAARIAVDKYTQAIKENAKQKAVADKVGDLFTKRLEKETEILEQQERKSKGGSEIKNLADRKIFQIQQEIKAIDQQIETYSKLGQTLNSNKQINDDSWFSKSMQLEREKKLLGELEAQQAALYNKSIPSGVLKDGNIPSWGTSAGFSDQAQFNLLTQRIEKQRELVAEKEKELDASRRLIEMEKELEYIPEFDEKKWIKERKKHEEDPKKTHARELNEIKMKFIEKKVTEDQYNQEIYITEVRHLAALIELRKKFKEDATDLETQLTDKLISEADRRYKLLQNSKDQIIKGIKTGKGKHREEIIKEDLWSPQRWAEQVDFLKLQYKQGIIKEEEYQKKLAEIREKFIGNFKNEFQDFFANLYDIELEKLNNFLIRYAKELGIVATMVANINGTIDNFNKAEEMAVERKYDKMIKAAGNNSQRVQQLEEEKEKKLHAIRAKYADKQFIITVANVIASTAVAAMEAFKAMAGIPVVGPVLGGIAAAAALAFGASQIAVAKQQRDAAKEGYYDGGYTDKGDDRDEAGVVHKNEFVNTAEAVRNPHVKKFLDVFDVAQKDGSIRMLNTTQILERARLGVSDQLRAVSPGSYRKADDQVNVILNRLTASVDRFTEKLDEPIESFTVISGPRGSRKRNEMYDKIMRNARL